MILNKMNDDICRLIHTYNVSTETYTKSAVYVCFLKLDIYNVIEHVLQNVF